MKKPIIRWTIGNVHKIGFDILSESVKLMKSLYDNFDLYICYNNLNDCQIDFLKKMKVPLISQFHNGELICPPHDVAWKLYPPRLDINTHEIFIDNDLILLQKLDEIQWFLDQDNAFISSMASVRLFGRRDNYVPKEARINSGLFGIPPHFDFAKAINKILKSSPCWLNRYDEQGTVAEIIGQSNYKLISNKKLSVSMIKNNFIHPAYLKFPSYGLHFCDANYGNSYAWKKYLAIKALNF